MSALVSPIAGPSRLPFVLASTARRTFHSSPISRSHVGSLPVPIPAGVTLDLAAVSATGGADRLRTVTVTGPRGSHSLAVPPFVQLAPPSAETDGRLVVSVADPRVKHQKASWGLVRALIGNAVRGVSEGYTLPIRLVGVGYRAAVEPVPPSLLFTRPTALCTSSVRGAHSVKPPTHRLNLKLGYAHPILIPIPKDISVATPQPTRIVLSGTDKQKLGLFGERIRRWRKPEPYRGKVRRVADSWRPDDQLM